MVISDYRCLFVFVLLDGNIVSRIFLILHANPVFSVLWFLGAVYCFDPFVTGLL